MRGFLIFAASIMMSGVFAGCVAGEGSTRDASLTTEPGPAEFSDDTGAIEGVIVDDEGLPLSGALVAILGSDDAPTTSAEDGTFSLSNIAPGKQVVAAQKIGYESVSRAVEVKAAEVTTVNLVLLALQVIENYHNSFTLKGFFDCTWLIPLSSGPCGYTYANDTIGNPLESMWTNSRRKWNYPAEPHLMTVTNEITWQKGTAATADELRVIMSHGPIDGKERNAGHNFCITGGPNPVRMRWEREAPDEDGACQTGSENPEPGPKTIDWEEGLLLQSFVSVDPASVGGVVSQPAALAYQQSFDLHISRFYGELAPGDWSAIPDA